MQHVWETGGTELCKLVRSQGWHVPQPFGCTDKNGPGLLVPSSPGWPPEDYQLVANEDPIYGGSVESDYVPTSRTENNKDWIEAHDVRWITTFRHP